MKIIEEKAQRYNRALTKSREFLAICEKCGTKDIVEFLEDIFPELKMDKESEDERIRKEILDYIDKATGCKRWVAWLEQQGKPVEINPTEFDLQLNRLLVQFETLTKEELASSLSFYLNVVKNGYLSDNVEPTGYNSIDPHFGEPVDKVEPKFKVGDWCIDNEDGLVFQIVKVLDNTYRYRTNEGKEYSCTHYSLELDARFWTISDAKDGDVLYTPKGAGAEGIFLIKGWEQVECIGKTLCSRIGYRVKDDEVVAGGLGAIWWEGVIDPFYPATKEQRDLLFQKMKEAGYKKDLSNFG